MTSRFYYYIIHVTVVIFGWKYTKLFTHLRFLRNSTSLQSSTCMLRVCVILLATWIYDMVTSPRSLIYEVGAKEARWLSGMCSHDTSPTVFGASWIWWQHLRLKKNPKTDNWWLMSYLTALEYYFTRYLQKENLFHFGILKLEMAL